MQSRLATKLSKILSFAATRNNNLQVRSSNFCSVSSGRTAEPEEHAREPEERPKGTPTKQQPIIKENDPIVSPKPPHSSSPKIESNSVHQPIDPINQQRRKIAEQTFKDVTCAGMDGTPWPEDKMDRRSQIRERVEDDKKYFEHHKASPLSEMEMADTRKPITRVTDETAGGDGGGGYYGGGDGVIVWRPEQLDTAEESLLRAKRIWEMNAMRGDPDSPHGRVLRALRGEYW